MRRKFGFTRDAPDEFQVTTRAPLAMPPDYALREPRPGLTRPQEQPLSTQAEAILVPEAALGNDTKPSSAEQALVRQAGPTPPRDIRAAVDTESDEQKPGQGVVSHLMFWQGDQPAGVVLDPDQEKARIKQVAAQPAAPKPAAQDSSGFFDWLF